MKVKQHKMMPVLIVEQLYIYIYICVLMYVFLNQATESLLSGYCTCVCVSTLKPINN